MTYKPTIDIISDLNLNNKNDFDWDNRATSLFCIVSGNISSDLTIIEHVLDILDKSYKGVFYIDGKLEHKNIDDYDKTVSSIKAICEKKKNVIYLFNNLVILNSIALLACNGWFDSLDKDRNSDEYFKKHDFRVHDVGYVANTIKSLQRHKDVKKIILISGTVPLSKLRFTNSVNTTDFDGDICLTLDTEKKVSTWIYGGTELVTDIFIDRVRFINNSKLDNQPYWPKAIEV